MAARRSKGPGGVAFVGRQLSMKEGHADRAANQGDAQQAGQNAVGFGLGPQFAENL